MPAPSLCRNLLIAVLIATVCWARHTSACPFCTALAPTMSDDLDSASAAVIASCKSSRENEDGIWLHRMRINEILKGDAGRVGSVIEVATSEKLSHEKTFWVLGYADDSIHWGAPTSISPQAVSYLRGLNDRTDSKSGRLKYFLRFLGHNDEMVSDDAYNEFAEASLEEIAALSDALDRTWVIGVLRDTSTTVHRRRLCWTFLSQCGTAADASLFDELLHKRKYDETFDPGMDAAIACYLTLGGENALARIERDYLSNRDVSYLDCYAAVSAIRVHGTELNVIPRNRLATAFHHVLGHPELADLVIPDLARWKDWSALNRVAKLFEDATEETEFYKPQAVRYLKACPLPSAAKALERLRKIDPDAVQKAEASMLFYGSPVAVPVPPALTEDDGELEQSASRRRQ